jgi:hypothetical protein
VSFEKIESDDLVFHIESEIEPPRRWVVSYNLLPWPHFLPLYDPPEDGSPGDAVLGRSRSYSLVARHDRSGVIPEHWPSGQSRSLSPRMIDSGHER